MIQISNLSIHFGGNYLFDSVSLNINPRDRIGLIGRNGTGKSTFLKIIAKKEGASEGAVLLPRDFTIGYLAQEIHVDTDKSIIEEAESSLVELKSLEQEIHDLNSEISNRTDYDSDSYMKLIEKSTHANDRWKILGGDSINAEIEKILLGLGFLRDDFYRLVNTFSGGWQMRLELAKLLLRKPDCILLDEPTNHLDIESISWLENFLKSYPGAVVIVSHDRQFLDNVTNRTFEIFNSKIYDLPVNYSLFVERRAEIKELELAAYKNQQRQIAEIERYVERFRSKATLASRVQSRIKALDKIERIELEDEDGAAINIRFPEPPRSARLVAEANQLSKSYGDNHVLDKIEFAIERGEKYAFVGKNGEGKSTFSRILAGIEEFDGNLNIGANVKIGYFAQHQAHILDPEATVLDIIDRAATGDMRKQIRNLLGAFLFSGDSVYKKVKVLSGGEKSRLSLARLILEPINFLILDEPTNHLDMLSKDVLKQALLEFKGSMIVVSHDREFLQGLTDKTVHFKNKKIKEYLGDINYFLDQTQLENLAQLERNDNRKNEDVKVSQNQMDREKRKEIQREEARLMKLITKVEENISELETQISNLEKEFLNPDFYSNPEAADKQAAYTKCQNMLNSEMEEWENLHEKLESLK